MVRAASSFGLELSGHLSRHFELPQLAESDLIVTMTRRHVRELVAPEAKLWSRTFTIRELVRRGLEVGPRGTDEPLSKWLALVHEGRQPAELLGSDPGDDVADPMHGIPTDYDEMVETLYGLTHELVGLLFPANS